MLSSKSAPAMLESPLLRNTIPCAINPSPPYLTVNLYDWSTPTPKLPPFKKELPLVFN